MGHPSLSTLCCRVCPHHVFNFFFKIIYACVLFVLLVLFALVQTNKAKTKQNIINFLICYFHLCKLHTPCYYTCTFYITPIQTCAVCPCCTYAVQDQSMVTMLIKQYLSRDMCKSVKLLLQIFLKSTLLGFFCCFTYLEKYLLF